MLKKLLARLMFVMLALTNVVVGHDITKELIFGEGYHPTDIVLGVFMILLFVGALAMVPGQYREQYLRLGGRVYYVIAALLLMSTALALQAEAADVAGYLLMRPASPQYLGLTIFMQGVLAFGLLVVAQLCARGATVLYGSVQEPDPAEIEQAYDAPADD